MVELFWAEQCDSNLRRLGMKDEDKTKRQLLDELIQMCRRMAELETGRKRT